MSDEMENKVEEDENEEEGSDVNEWWKGVLGGLFMFALAGFLYWYFTDFENSNDRSRRMNALIAALYNLGGKNLACGVVAGIGAILVGWGFWDFTKSRKK
ncbi:hypothetical protein KKC22_07420 [Myxococcota bacterium]|nr:hypothetical protein [Myxococcota bacterium]